MDRKSKYCKEGNSLQIDVQIQCKSNQKPNRYCFCFVVLESDELILKFIWKCKGPRKTSMSKNENKVRILSLSNIKTSHKSIVIKTVWYWLWGDKPATGKGDSPESHE